MTDRLRLKRLDTSKPKEVLKSNNFRIIKSITPAMLAIMNDLKNRIENGATIDDYFYRAEIDVNIDTVLGKYGILHLHLGQGSSELLFLAQFEDHVVFMEVWDHTVFEPGNAHLLNGRHPGIDFLAANKKAAEEKAKRERAQNVATSIAKLRKKPPTTEGFIPSMRFLINLLRRL